VLRTSGRIAAVALVAATVCCGFVSCGEGPHILYGFLDDQGLWVITPQYTDARAPSEGLIPVQNDDLWGFVDSAGKVVIAPRFDAVLPFTEGLAAVQGQGAWSFIDPAGKVVIGGPFAEAHPFHGGLAAVEIDERWGFVDHAGTLVIEPRFDEVGDDLQRDGAIFHLPCFNEGRCAASMEGRWGFVDRSGAWVIPPRYKEAMGFREGRAAVREWSEDDTGKVGFVDRHGGWVIEPRFAASLWFSGGRAVAMVDRDDVQTATATAPEDDEEQHYRAILIDTQGREVADLRWGDEIAGGALEGLSLLAPDYLAEGMVPASDGQHWGFMSRDGEWLIPPSFALVFPFKRGLAPAAVSNDPDADFLEFDGWGLIDHGGRWVVKPELKALGPYDGASLPAQLHQRWGLLDRDGRWRVEPRYADAGDWLALPGTVVAMADGLYRFGVYANHRWSAVDSRGRRSPGAEYEWLEGILAYPELRDDGSQRLAYLQEGRWGLADKRLQTVVPAQFDARPQWSGRDGLLQVERAGQTGCIDASGRWVIPAEFEQIEECGRGEVSAKRDTGWGVWKPGSGWHPSAPGESPAWWDEDHSGWVYLDGASTWRPVDGAFRLYRGGVLQDGVPAVDEVRREHTESAATLERSAIAVVRRGENWGVLDARGKVLLPFRFEAVGGIYDGRYAVRVGGKWGIVDGGGREVFPPVFEQAMPFNRDVAIFCEEGHCGLVDKARTVLLAPTYSGIEPLSASVATAFMLYEDGTEQTDHLISSGLVDATGKVLVGQEYYSISTFSRHLLLAWDSGGRYHLLDSASGQPLTGLPELAHRPGKLSEGLAAVDLRQPEGGVAAGYIDTRGKLVIEPAYDAKSAKDFAGGVAIVSRAGRCGVIDKRGQPVLPLEYQHCQRLADGRVLFAEEAPLRIPAPPGRSGGATPPVTGSPAP
jgi:hypothetical protein